MPPSAQNIEEVLAHFPLDGATWASTPNVTVRPLGGGLINHTYLVEQAGRRRVLQWVNPIFDSKVHQNIQAVCEQLRTEGLATPQLERTRQGGLCLESPRLGVWRMMTLVEGESFERATSVEQTRSGGELVGRFHRALRTLSHDFAQVRPPAHVRKRHLANMKRALSEHTEHRIFSQVQSLSDELFALCDERPPQNETPDIVGHGDLKLANLQFVEGGRKAHALVDLDTVGPIVRAFELGDAWRSWCNPAGEDTTNAEFRLDLFEASWKGYLSTANENFSQSQLRELLDGVEWLCIELALRFATDALHESYFGWDHARFQSAGEHNLLRAQGQLCVYRNVQATSAERAKILGLRG